MKEIPSIGIALSTGLLASQVQRVAEKHIPALGNNPTISSALLGLIGGGMVFFGSDKLNPAGYALIGSAGYDMSEDVSSAVMQGISRIAPMQGITRLGAQDVDMIQGQILMAEEEEREI